MSVFTHSYTTTNSMLVILNENLVTTYEALICCFFNEVKHFFSYLFDHEIIIYFVKHLFLVNLKLHQVEDSV